MKATNPASNDTPDMKRLLPQPVCPGAFLPPSRQSFPWHGRATNRWVPWTTPKLPLFSYGRDGHQPYSRGLCTHYKVSLLQYKELIDPATYSRGLSHCFKIFADWCIVLDYSLIRCYVLAGLSYWSRIFSHQFPRNWSLWSLQSSSQFQVEVVRVQVSLWPPLDVYNLWGLLSS